MLKRVVFGESQFKELHQVFKFGIEDFEAKKVRLFPAGNTESEVHTTSIFLSSLCAVKEYREDIFLNINIKKIKNNNIKLHAYAEISNISKEERTDALLVITSGKYSPIIEWAAFVEVKIGKNIIEQSQIDRYIDFAQSLGITNIITISNELVTSPINSPVSTRKKSFKLYHWSWPYLKVTAGRLINGNLIEDDDHIYILRELRRYLDTHRKLTNFTNMGADWKESVNCIRSDSESDKHLDAILNAVIQEEKDNSLQLTDKTGLFVELITKGNRKDELRNMLKRDKTIVSNYYIDRNKKYSFSIGINFKLREISCFTIISIAQGKAQAQTTKLIKLLGKDSGINDRIIIDAVYPRNRSLRGSVSLNTLIDEKDATEPYSILNKAYGDTIKYFDIRVIGDLPAAKFQSKTNFIIELEQYSKRFVDQVMQEIIS